MRENERKQIHSALNSERGCRAFARLTMTAAHSFGGEFTGGSQPALGGALQVGVKQVRSNSHMTEKPAPCLGDGKNQTAAD
jgi:hypothetical protein